MELYILCHDEHRRVCYDGPGRFSRNGDNVIMNPTIAAQLEIPVYP